MRVRNRVMLLSAIGVIALVESCGGGKVIDVTTGPVTPVDTTKPISTVQRASLTVRVAFDPDDAAIASAAGLSVSGITVRITRNAAGFTPQSATTAADGTARFENLLDGGYQVSADRSLTAIELNRLAFTDRDASVFSGGADVVVSPPANATATVALVANRRGSIVISELFAFNSPPTTSTAYGFGTYLEVFNNSDSTAYLDGMLLLHTPFSAHFKYSPLFPCTGYPQSLRLDSTSIIGVVVFAFPGSGHEYPVLPGQAKVVAMDAIDHRAAAPDKDQVDLSRADFEEIGSAADTDNPFAANMTNVLAGGGYFGRGYPFIGAPFMWVLMSASARAEGTSFAYPNSRLELGGTSETLKYSSKYRLDILSVDYVPGSNGAPSDGYARCVPWTAPAFDQAPAALLDGSGFVRIAISRKSLGRTADGREILQRTRTSARDFEYHQPLLRSLLKP